MFSLSFRGLLCTIMIIVATNQGAAQSVSYCYVDRSTDCGQASVDFWDDGTGSSKFTCGDCVPPFDPGNPWECLGVDDVVFTPNSTSINFAAKHAAGVPPGDLVGKTSVTFGNYIMCGTQDKCLGTCLPPNPEGQRVCEREYLMDYDVPERFASGSTCYVNFY